MGIPLIPIIISAAVGLVGGALARQPEVNRLREQVRVLQKEIERLQRVVEEQDRQISELKVRYQTLKAWNFSEKARQGARTRGAIIHQWALGEYIELLYVKAREQKTTTRENEFFNAYEALLSGSEGTLDDARTVKHYIEEKYDYEIKHLQVPEPVQMTQVLKGDRVA